MRPSVYGRRNIYSVLTIVCSSTTLNFPKETLLQAWKPLYGIPVAGLHWFQTYHIINSINFNTLSMIWLTIHACLPEKRYGPLFFPNFELSWFLYVPKNGIRQRMVMIDLFLLIRNIFTICLYSTVRNLLEEGSNFSIQRCQGQYLQWDNAIHWPLNISTWE